MPYVPQFIETNPAALQNTLNQYQQAYDTETQRSMQASDVYNQLPTNNPIDQIEKEKVMQGFSKAVDDLDKKYNYDRANSQYAKDLAKTITGLRAHPIWSLMQQKDEIGKQRREAMVKMGANYWENTNPLTATINDPSPIQNWQVKDLGDLQNFMATAGKEYATSTRSSTPTSKDIGNGYIQFAYQYGHKTYEDAAKWLNTPDGDKWLTDNIVSSGFNPNDPLVREKATSSALTQLVGQPDYQIQRKYQDDGSLASSKGKSGGSSDGPVSPLAQVSNQADVSPIPYPVTKISEIKSLDTDIEKINKDINKPGIKPEEKKILEQKKEDIAFHKDRINEVRRTVENQNYDKISVGKSITRDVLNQYSEFNKLSELKKQIVEETLFNNLLNDHIDSNEAQRKGSVYIINPLTGGFKLEKNIGGPTKLSQKVTKSGYVENNKLSNFRDWYKGVGDYSTNGYQSIEQDINNRLDKGEGNVFDVYSPNVDVKSDAYKRQTDFVKANLRFMLPLEKEFRAGKGGTEWDQKKLDAISAQLDNENTTIHYMFDNDDKAYIQVHNPGGKSTNGDWSVPSTTVTLKVDPARSNMDVYQNLAEVTGDPRFLDVKHSSIKMVNNKSYTIDDNSEFGKMLAKHPDFQDEDGKADLSAIKGMQIMRRRDSEGHIKYEIYDSYNDTTPEPYNSKAEALQALQVVALPNKVAAVETSVRMGNSKKGQNIKLSDANSFNSFKNLIGQKESSGDYNAINEFTDARGNRRTAYGKYQFMESTIEGLGYDIDEFINDPDLQDKAMEELTSQNIKSIASLGYNIDINKLTPESNALLAVAHYGGIRAVKALLDGSNWVKKPQYGIDNAGNKIKYPSVVEYMTKQMGIDPSKLNFESLKG